MEFDYLYKKNRKIDVELYNAVSTDSLESIKSLIATGADPHACIIQQNYLSPDDANMDETYFIIHEAARNPDISVLQYLISLGVNPNVYDYWGCQPLSYAAFNNSLEIIQYLVELGNDPCKHDDDGGNVISHAALNPDIRVLEYLLSKGADIDTVSDVTGLINALEKGTIERIQFFLEHGANLEDAMCLIDCNDIPLENLKFILECGFNPNTTNDYDEKIIDLLDAERRALFIEYGGQVS